MPHSLRPRLFFCLSLAFVFGAVTLPGEVVQVTVSNNASPRVGYGVVQLQEALRTVGFEVAVAHDMTSMGKPFKGRQIEVLSIGPEGIQPALPAVQLLRKEGKLWPEGFSLEANSKENLWIYGNDDSGTLYGCLELAKRIRESKTLPSEIHFSDAPQFKLRGPCIGMQKTYILPGRHVYEYPYTTELFPFFYDKAFWTEYLDYLVANRMNTLYLWSGHPFASLVKLPDYPYALEVSEEQYQKNVEMFRYVAKEADKRGIWLVQMFYNIILSKPFAEKNGLSTQLKAPVPIAADYTRKSIAEFVKQYPNVGLMVCLGEALQGLDNQVQWCTDVVLAGVRDGMQQAGLKEEPPVVIRTHATDARVVIPAALKVYKNLYTEAKFNGESLTTWEPRGTWQDLHQTMSKLGSTHVANIHILANLEPFRYGAQRFIHKSVLAARDRLGARGIHLYPLSYWNWPDAPDKTEPPLKQIERDWIWFEAWARYAWNPDVDEAQDHAYWVGRLTEKFGNAEAASHILDAYNDSGECAPRILRRFGITEGNRQTMSLGMTLDELVYPEKFRAYSELWDSQAPPGERLQEFVDKEWTHQEHHGETPAQIIKEILAYSDSAVKAIALAGPTVSKNREEYERLRNDMACIQAMSKNYAAKANAAECVLRYAHSHDVKDMEEAEVFLAESLDHYRTLAKLTESTYVYANSMQTSQRRIPVSGGVNGKPANYHWVQLLPVYEKELVNFKKQVVDLKQGGGVGAAAGNALKPFRKVEVKVLSAGAETYHVQVGSKIFTDRDYEIQSLASQLDGLTGIRFSDADARVGKSTPVEFETTEPVQVLVGYIQSKDKGWRQAPELETDALAGEHDSNEPLILNAATVDGLPGITVYAVNYPKGRHKLELRGNGSFVVLGVAAAEPRP